MLNFFRKYTKRIWNTLFKNRSKCAVCSKVLLLLLALQPVFSNACYVYWHHAPMIPESMKRNIEIED